MGKMKEIYVEMNENGVYAAEPEPMQCFIVNVDAHNFQFLVPEEREQQFAESDDLLKKFDMSEKVVFDGVVIKSRTKVEGKITSATLFDLAVKYKTSRSRV